MMGDSTLRRKDCFLFDAETGVDREVRRAEDADEAREMDCEVGIGGQQGERGLERRKETYTEGI